MICIALSDAASAAAKFYAEDLAISADRAERIASFLALVKGRRAVIDAKPWAGHGKARVYITLWSQNRLPPIEFLSRAFYDADDNELYFLQLNYGERRRAFSDCMKMPAGCFSGAKTREAIREFCEVLYG